MERIFHRQARLMGSDFSFQVVAGREGIGESLLDQCIVEVRRIESLLTEFQPDSETSRINKAAGSGWVEVSKEVFELLVRCKQLSEITQGAFDISGVALRELYNFKGQSFSFPSPKILRDKLQFVGYQNIRLERPNRVQLAKPAMHIAFGAIGKGYAAESVKKLMVGQKVAAGAINASGDLTVWGTRPDGIPWKVGIANPDLPSEVLLWLELTNAAIATSGDYEQFFEYEGKRYSHNLDPKSGLPVSGIKSVSVISPDAGLSDALATAVFVLGVDLGIDLIDQLPETHCVIVNDKTQIYSSSQLKLPITNVA